MNEKTVWESYTEEDKKKVYDFCEEYRMFLSKCKTERECVKEILKEAEAKGYRSLKEVRKSGEKLQAGDKVYVSIMGKTLALFHIGEKPMEKGMNILGAHIDSPRLDLKQNPLYETDGLAMLETHYYGGIKKYQWVAAGTARCCGKKRRHDRGDRTRRRSVRSGDRHFRPASASWQKTDGKAWQ